MKIKIDPIKTAWSDSDWPIYLKNLKLLCKKHNILQKEFNHQVGVVAAFRRDIKRPSNELINKIASYFGVSTDWLLTYHDDFELEKVSEPDNSYDPHGGWKPRSIEQLVGLPEDHGMGRAFEMLVQIYSSRDENVIRAILSLLRVFCERVDKDNEIAKLKREKAELRDLVKNHAKAHAYYGEDRRSGGDRRQTDGIGPGGIERRSGMDRRKPEEGNGAD